MTTIVVLSYPPLVHVAADIGCTTALHAAIYAVAETMLSILLIIKRRRRKMMTIIRIPIITRIIVILIFADDNFNFRHSTLIAVIVKRIVMMRIIVIKTYECFL